MNNRFKRAIADILRSFNIDNKQTQLLSLAGVLRFM